MQNNSLDSQSLVTRDVCSHPTFLRTALPLTHNKMTNLFLNGPQSQGIKSLKLLRSLACENRMREFWFMASYSVFLSCQLPLSLLPRLGHVLIDFLIFNRSCFLLSKMCCFISRASFPLYQTIASNKANLV